MCCNPEWRPALPNLALGALKFQHDLLGGLGLNRPKKNQGLSLGFRSTKYNKAVGTKSAAHESWIPSRIVLDTLYESQRHLPTTWHKKLVKAFLWKTGLVCPPKPAWGQLCCYQTVWVVSARNHCLTWAPASCRTVSCPVHSKRLYQSCTVTPGAE